MQRLWEVGKHVLCSKNRKKDIGTQHNKGSRIRQGQRGRQGSYPAVLQAMVKITF